MAKVLLIEDEAIFLIDLSDQLKKKGHQVFTAQNGIEGLEALSNNPEIIFCDYRMPRMNGYAFCKAVKTDPQYKSYSNIPIVSIGSFPRDEREYLAKFMEKPILYREVFQAVEDFVKK